MSLFQNKYRIESTRLNFYDYRNAGWYFITIVTKDRVNYFGEIKNGKMILNSEGEILNEEWEKTSQMRNNVNLDYYIIMPNHFHGILIIENKLDTKNYSQSNLKSDSLGSIVGQMKSIVTKRIRLSGKTEFEWQKGFFEHIIRNEKSLFNIRKYIENNPFKWNEDPENPEHVK